MNDFKPIKLKPAPPNISGRRTPRRSFEHAVGILHHGVYEVRQAKELSEGGIQVELEPHIAVGDSVLVSLVLPGKNVHVIVRAHVVYRNEKAKSLMMPMGLQFSDLPAQLRRNLRDYIAAKSQEEALREAA